MTKTYSFTFRILRKKDGTDGHSESDYYWEPITLTKKITDRMEERDSWKPVVAANYFTQVMRNQYGCSNRSCAHTNQLKEI